MQAVVSSTCADCASLASVVCPSVSVSLVGVLERVVWHEMGPEMGHTIVEHPEALLLPSKPAQPASATPAFPSQQSIKEHAPQPPIKQVTR